MNNEEVTKLLLTIGGTYSNFKPNEMTLPTWLRLLREVPANLAHDALDAYMAQGREFPPQPGQILKIIKDRLEPPGITADEAWADAISAAGTGDIGRIEDPRARAAAHQVGFDRLRLANTETELPFVRRDFIQAFGRALERDRQVEQTQLPSESPALRLIQTVAEKKSIPKKIEAA